MIAKASDILKIALAEVGTHESPIGSNNVKYNTEYYGRTINDPAYAWCVVFVWWCFKKAGASAQFCNGIKTAYCPYVYNFYKTKGKVVTTPKPGDLVLFDFNKRGYAGHIGIVYSVNADGSIVTIEGNTSKNNQSNGGYVEKKVRAKSLIWKLVRPDYAPETTPKKDTPKQTFVKALEKAFKLTVDGKADAKLLAATITLSTTKNSKHAIVKPLQVYLKSLGYNCGTADGSYGPKTEAAVKKYQKAKKTGTVDGVISAKGPTWKKLLGLS